MKPKAACRCGLSVADHIVKKTGRRLSCAEALRRWTFLRQFKRKDDTKK